MYLAASKGAIGRYAEDKILPTEATVDKIRYAKDVQLES